MHTRSFVEHICTQTHTHTYTRYNLYNFTRYEQQSILCILNDSTEELLVIKYATSACVSLPVCQDGVDREV